MTKEQLIDSAMQPQKEITCTFIEDDKQVTYSGRVDGYSTGIKSYIRLNTREGVKTINANTISRVNDDVLHVPKNKIYPHNSGGYEVYFEGNYAGKADNKKQAKQLLRTCLKIKKIYEHIR